MRFNRRLNSQLLELVLVISLLVLGQLHTVNVRAQEEDLEELFSQARSNSALRAAFIKAYVQHEGLPAHVIRIQYSEQIEKLLATTNPLVETDSGNYRFTSHALAIGRGYPSSMVFGPEMFNGDHRYADFLSVIQHEAAHAKFWATAELNYLGGVDTGKNSKVRLRGLFPILFELDALKTQMEHPSWQQTSVPFRTGQWAYRQKWLDKLEQLEQESYVYDLKPLLDNIRRTYR